MKRCRLSVPAQRDLHEIRAYIAQDNPAAALRFVRLLRAKCQALAEMPGMGREREELGAGFRSFPVARYVIFYRQMKGGIEVLRVVHGARDIDNLFS